jgi:LPS-assembly protein
MKRHTGALTAVAITLSSFTCTVQLNGLDASSPVEITAEKAVSFEEGIVAAESHVQIHHKDICVYCDYAEYKADTQEALLVGNVSIYSPNSLTSGQHVLYNVRSKQARISEFFTTSYPMLLYARSACILPHGFRARQVYFTTDDQLQPGYHIRAKTVHLYKNKNARIVFLFPTFYIGRTPIFWMPYLSVGPNDTGFKVLPGYDRGWGVFALAMYSFAYDGPNSSRLGTVRIDCRARHGMAFGFDTTVRTSKNEDNYRNFISYWTCNSKRPFVGKGGPIPDNTSCNRYRLSYNQHIVFSENTYVSCDLNALSDCNVMQDFFPAESRTNPRPDNNISLTRRGQNYTLNLLNRFQINSFQNTVKRLPELAWDIKQHPIFGSPFYLEGTWTLGQLERSFGDGLRSRAGSKQLLKKRDLRFVTKSADYPVFRLGSFAKISMPKTYFGWIALMPYAGFHATLYSQSSGFFDKLPTLPIDPDGHSGTYTAFADRRGPFRKRGFVAPNTQGNNTTVWNGAFHGKEDSFRKPMGPRGGIAFHPGINCGLESSFKISRVYRLQSQLLGLDGLMHIVQPYVSHSVVRNLRSKPSLTYQFDAIQQTTQSLPINFPDFLAIDAIDSWNIFRTGVRNNFITRRDSRNHQWLTVDTFFDYNLHNPYSLAKVGNLNNLVAYCPSRWFTVGCGIQAPLDREGFTQFDLNFSLMPAQNLQFTIGYYYLNSYPTRCSLGACDPSSDVSQMALDAYFRLNDNWAISGQEQYDANRRLLLHQRYFIHRDLSSWIASFGMDIRRNQDQKLQTGFVLVMTLKAAPQVIIPLGLDPLHRPLWPSRSL